MPPLSLLAANAGDIVPVVIVVFTVLSGLVNFLRERAQAAKMQQEQGGVRSSDPAVDSEIEAFLADVGAKPNRSRTPVRSGDEFVDDDTPPERVLSRKPARKNAASKKKATEPEPVRQKVAERKTVRERHMQSQVKEHHLKSQVAQQHLATGSVTAPQPIASADPKTVEFGSLFATNDDVRRAILMSEVLAPPLSRRKKP